MGGAAQAVVGQALQHVAHVHHDVIWQGGDAHPFSSFVQHLQAVGRSTDQQGDQVDVLVLACAHGAVGLLGDGRVVDGTQDAVAVAHLVVKVSFLESEVDGDGAQHVAAGFLKLAVGAHAHLVHVRELADFYVIRVHVADGIAVVYFLAKVPEFLEVSGFGVLGVFAAEGHVAALACEFRDFVTELGFYRKLEEFLHGAVQLFLEFRVDRVVAHSHKTDGFVGLAELIDKSLFASWIA